MQSRDEALKLFHDNVTLAYFIRNRYGSILDGCRGLSGDDIDQICLLGLWTAALRFDPARGIKFSTYAVSVVRGAMRNTRKAEVRNMALGGPPFEFAAADRPVCAESCSDFNDYDPADIAEAACIQADYDAFVRALPEKKRLIVDCRGAGMTQAEIGYAAGISQVQVSRIIRRIARTYAATMG